MIWDYADGYCCECCGVLFTGLYSDQVTEELDWTVGSR